MMFLAIWAPQKGPKKVHEGPQVGRMYDPMSGLDKRPLTKLLDHFFRRNGPKQPENSLFYAVFGHLGTPKWTQKSTQRPASGRDVWPIVRA
jgi:hypothetical protein